MWVDAKSGAVNPRFVQLRAGLSQQQARAEAVIHWDRNECRRIGQWNLEMAVYLARNRIMRHMQHTLSLDGHRTWLIMLDRPQTKSLLMSMRRAEADVRKLHENLWYEHPMRLVLLL